MNPNWAEQVTAIATAIGCIGLTSTLVLAVLAARQLREAQRGRPELTIGRRVCVVTLHECPVALVGHGHQLSS